MNTNTQLVEIHNQITTKEMSDRQSSLSIAGIDEPIVTAYFKTLVAQEFATTASLFAANGELRPPFEDAVVGNEAIATYLAQEAVGLKPYPREGIAQYFDDGTVHLKITGRAELPWCAVNVAWRFALDRDRQITCVAIDLLATMQELLKFRRDR